MSFRRFCLYRYHTWYTEEYWKPRMSFRRFWVWEVPSFKKYFLPERRCSVASSIVPRVDAQLEPRWGSLFLYCTSADSPEKAGVYEDRQNVGCEMVVTCRIGSPAVHYNSHTYNAQWLCCHKEGKGTHIKIVFILATTYGWGSPFFII